MTTVTAFAEREKVATIPFDVNIVLKPLIAVQLLAPTFKDLLLDDVMTLDQPAALRLGPTLSTALGHGSLMPRLRGVPVDTPLVPSLKWDLTLHPPRPAVLP
jgi:hypothetical protein